MVTSIIGSVDIEDLELASLYELRGFRRYQHFLRHIVLKGWFHPRAAKYEYIVDHMTPFADQITVVSSFLQKRYGGIKLPHGADTVLFDPDKYDGQQSRGKLGIDASHKVVLFAGSPKKHKGLDMLLEAVSRLTSRYRLVVLIVGGNRCDPLLNHLLDKYPDCLLHVESRPHSQMPCFLSACDFVVIPQSDDLYARAQVPGKIFEAMAMGKPIVASRVSDLPEILEGCGMLFDPGDADSLTQQMRTLCENRDLATELAREARERCIKHYSWDAMERILTRQVLAQWI